MRGQEMGHRYTGDAAYICLPKLAKIRRVCENARDDVTTKKPRQSRTNSHLRSRSLLSHLLLLFPSLLFIPPFVIYRLNVGPILLRHPDEEPRLDRYQDMYQPSDDRHRDRNHAWKLRPCEDRYTNERSHQRRCDEDIEEGRVKRKKNLQIRMRVHAVLLRVADAVRDTRHTLVVRAKPLAPTRLLALVEQSERAPEAEVELRAALYERLPEVEEGYDSVGENDHERGQERADEAARAELRAEGHRCVGTVSDGDVVGVGEESDVERGNEDGLWSSLHSHSPC